MNEDRCPTCGSPDPRLHPATQAEGEVTHICPDMFHSRHLDSDGELCPCTEAVA